MVYAGTIRVVAIATQQPDNLSVPSSRVKKSKKKSSNTWHATYMRKGVGGDRLSGSVLPANMIG